MSIVKPLHTCDFCHECVAVCYEILVKWYRKSGICSTMLYMELENAE